MKEKEQKGKMMREEEEEEKKGEEHKIRGGRRLGDLPV